MSSSDKVRIVSSVYGFELEVSRDELKHMIVLRNIVADDIMGDGHESSNRIVLNTEQDVLRESLRYLNSRNQQAKKDVMDRMCQKGLLGPVLMLTDFVNAPDLLDHCCHRIAAYLKDSTGNMKTVAQFREQLGVDKEDFLDKEEENLVIKQSKDTIKKEEEDDE